MNPAVFLVGLTMGLLLAVAMAWHQRTFSRRSRSSGAGVHDGLRFAASGDEQVTVKCRPGGFTVTTGAVVVEVDRVDE